MTLADEKKSGAGPNTIGRGPHLLFPEPISAEPRISIRRPIMRQSWRDVAFIHWRCDPAIVRRLIPRELELDLFEGECWVGLVPFLITDLTTPKGPAVPWLSEFPETNVRAYVVDASGRRGVWFFSLDAARWPAVAGARLGFGLPYFWSRMNVDSREIVSYTSARLWGPAAMSRIAVRPGVSVDAPTAIELFLTARFRLYAQRRGRLVMAEIRHQPWPLESAELVDLEQDLAQAAGLPGPPPESAPLVHFARGVDVIVSPPAPV
jgi:uncharacterized protein